MSFTNGLSVLSRNFRLPSTKSVSSQTRAGQNYRLSQGKARSGNEDTPLHDFHDFHFTDGTAPAMTKKQLHNLHKANAEEARFQKLAKEMVDLHEEWAEIDALQAQSVASESVKVKKGKKEVHSS